MSLDLLTFLKTYDKAQVPFAQDYNYKKIVHYMLEIQKDILSTCVAYIDPAFE